MTGAFEQADMTDPTQHFAWALKSFPHKGNRVPVPPNVIPEWSKFLWDLGFRHQPDEQVLFPMPSAGTGMGWINPDTYVDRETYEASRPARTDTTAPTETHATLQSLLSQIDPNLAAQIGAMSDEEKAQMLAEMERQNTAGKALEALNVIRKELGES